MGLFQGTVPTLSYQNCNISMEGASGPAGCSFGISAKRPSPRRIFFSIR